MGEDKSKKAIMSRIKKNEVVDGQCSRSKERSNAVANTCGLGGQCEVMG